MNANSAPNRVIHIHRLGNLGNQMLQYMAAITLSEKIGGCRISGAKMPDWGIDLPDISQVNPNTLKISSEVSIKLDMDSIKSLAERSGIERIDLQIYSSHIGNLLPHDQYGSIFKSPAEVPGYGEDVLLINIRGAEILTAAHPQYTVVPIEFYSDLVERTKLRPVFLGQLGGGAYISRLRSAFPHAEFIPSRGAVTDFAALRNSKNIVVSVSTFSWLAAWLSNADRIFMPLTGFYNPAQYSRAHLIPSGDPRYVYYQFPINYAVKDEDIEAAHRSLIGQWRHVTEEQIRAA